MKLKNWKSRWFSMIGVLSIAGMILAGVVAAPTAAALAQAATPPPKAGQQVRDQILERAYRREQAWLALQQQNLDRMNQIVTKVQNYIAAQQAKGKDVSALQAALAAFQQQIAVAQSSHTTAATALGNHAGFDANGNVTDPALARQTILDGRQALRDAHRVIRQAVTDLRRASRAWRTANGLTAQQPAATPSS